MNPVVAKVLKKTLTTSATVVGALFVVYFWNLAQELAKQGSTVLGVAFCMQGIVSADGQLITFGKIMNNTGLKLNELSHGLNYPSLMIHDSDASAMAELWFDHNLKDAVCIYLERRPRGAVIVDGSLYQGPNQCNGSIEHMTLIPGGNTCYCGQQGCMDTYCSPETLMEDGESLPGFFSVLEQGEQEHRERFSQWLDYMALAVTNIRSVLAGDVIISGEAAQYLDDDDMAGLRERVVEHTPFGTTDFTLRKGMALDHQDIIGAALRFVEPYVRELCDM